MEKEHFSYDDGYSLAVSLGFSGTEAEQFAEGYSYRIQDECSSDDCVVLIDDSERNYYVLDIKISDDEYSGSCSRIGMKLRFDLELDTKDKDNNHYIINVSEIAFNYIMFSSLFEKSKDVLKDIDAFNAKYSFAYHERDMSENPYMKTNIENYIEKLYQE